MYETVIARRVAAPSGETRGSVLFDPRRYVAKLGARREGVRSATGGCRFLRQQRELDVAVSLGVFPSILPGLLSRGISEED